MIGAIIGGCLTLAIVIVGAAWVLGTQIARTRQMVEDMPARLNGTVIRDHESRCGAFRPSSDPSRVAL